MKCILNMNNYTEYSEFGECGPGTQTPPQTKPHFNLSPHHYLGLQITDIF